jgi:hypothetical protein
LIEGKDNIFLSKFAMHFKEWNFYNL